MEREWSRPLLNLSPHKAEDKIKLPLMILEAPISTDISTTAKNKHSNQGLVKIKQSSNRLHLQVTTSSEFTVFDDYNFLKLLDW